MITASGDQTLRLWDTGLAEEVGRFRGHSGSIKTVCPQRGGGQHVFASGAVGGWVDGAGGRGGA